MFEVSLCTAFEWGLYKCSKWAKHTCVVNFKTLDACVVGLNNYNNNNMQFLYSAFPGRS